MWNPARDGLNTALNRRSSLLVSGRVPPLPGPILECICKSLLVRASLLVCLGGSAPTLPLNLFWDREYRGAAWISLRKLR